MGFHNVAQSGLLEFLVSSDPPTSASQSAGITDMSHRTRPTSATSSILVSYSIPSCPDFYISLLPDLPVSTSDTEEFILITASDIILWTFKFHHAQNPLICFTQKKAGVPIRLQSSLLLGTCLTFISSCSHFSLSFSYLGLFAVPQICQALCTALPWDSWGGGIGSRTS